ncbi:hypothetical protein V1477_002429 [Vespula maculifrons]|uniref:Uncharacterized protein n=1 Tax=Vespula maculifrons TaxID=7453 RepID=A0ABD2CXW0_VESMC
MDGLDESKKFLQLETISTTAQNDILTSEYRHHEIGNELHAKKFVDGLINLGLSLILESIPWVVFRGHDTHAIVTSADSRLPYAGIPYARITRTKEKKRKGKERKTKLISGELERVKDAHLTACRKDSLRNLLANKEEKREEEEEEKETNKQTNKRTNKQTIEQK